VARRLIGELHGQQTSLSEVFSVLARDPDSVDEGAILKQLDNADADTARIAAEGARTADRDLWARLQQHRSHFRARRATFWRKTSRRLSRRWNCSATTKTS
jgi:multidrug resistance efflux pump